MAPSEPNAIPFRAKGELPQFAEEKEGWRGYIEWEKYPEKKERVREIMQNYDFPDPPEFQLQPLPNTNPILTGERFKQYHYACGLASIPDYSWDVVKEEKSEDMIHVLQFPYNGEPPRVSSIQEDSRGERSLTNSAGSPGQHRDHGQQRCKRWSARRSIFPSLQNF